MWSQCVLSSENLRFKFKKQKLWVMTNQLINIAKDQITLYNPNKSPQKKKKITNTSKLTKLILFPIVLHFSLFLYPFSFFSLHSTLTFLVTQFFFLSFTYYLISSPTLTWRNMKLKLYMCIILLSQILSSLILFWKLFELKYFICL